MRTIVRPTTLRALTSSVLVLALGTLGHAHDAAAQDLDLSGDWVLTVQSPNGTGERQVTFVQDGEKLSGEISSSRAAGVLSGTVQGLEVSFVASVQMDSGPFEITYLATVTDGEMKGTVDFGDYGAGTFTGRRSLNES